MVFAHDCSVINYEFPGDKVTVTDEAGCVAACNDSGSCAQWSFDSVTKNCQLSTKDGNSAQPRFNNNVHSAPKAGHEQCGACPSTPLPSGTPFPPQDVNASQSLFGKNANSAVTAQPLGLQCWPKDADRTLYHCSAPTDVRRVNVSGWTGQCKGLSAVKLGDTADSCGQNFSNYDSPACVAKCEASCKNNVMCSMWQVVPPGDGRGQHRGCFQGVGYDCQAGNFNVTDAARLQRGHVQVIANITGCQVKGLKQVFGVGAHGTAEEGAANCKEVCGASLQCNVWQYYTEQTGLNGGCWIEAAEDSKYGALKYPLTQAQCKVLPNTTVVTDGGIQGEFIQHYCEEPLATATNPPPFAAPVAPVAGGWPGWLWPLLALALLLLCCGICGLVYCLTSTKPKKKKGARSRTLVETKEKMVESPRPVQRVVSATPTYFVQAQPAPTYSAPVQYVTAPVQYAAAPVQYAAAPVTTQYQTQYAAAPVTTQYQTQYASAPATTTYATAPASSVSYPVQQAYAPMSVEGGVPMESAAPRF